MNYIPRGVPTCIPHINKVFDRARRRRLKSCRETRDLKKTYRYPYGYGRQNMTETRNIIQCAIFPRRFECITNNVLYVTRRGVISASERVPRSRGHVKMIVSRPPHDRGESSTRGLDGRRNRSQTHHREPTVDDVPSIL